MLAGVVQSAAVEHARLTRRIRDAQAKLQSLQGRTATLASLMGANQTAVVALDTTISLMHAGVEPSAAGVVHAWAGKYGKRGALNEYLLKTLREASSGISTTALLDQAAVHFGLALPSSEARARFRDVVKPRLREFRDKGWITPLHEGRNGQMGLWRWKQPDTLADLSTRAAAIAKAASDDASRARAGSPAHPNAS
jgi:hypothetical protein